MAVRSVDEIRRDEYRQQRRVAALRRQVYGRADPAEAADRMTELQQADDELQALRDQRVARESEERASSATALVTPAGDASGVQLGATTTGIEASAELRMSHVPTSVVHLLEAAERPLVTCRLLNRADRILRIRVSSSVEGYSATAMTTIELEPYKQEPAAVDQLPTFFPASLERVREITRATLRVTVENLDAGMELATTLPIWLLARTTAVLAILDPSTSQWAHLSNYLGAWVTPNVEEVQMLLREAADHHDHGTIDGYQGVPGGVPAQVKAVYDALKAHDLTYVNSVIAAGAGELEAMQRVRLPREALNSRSANCLDGTVLMASVLEAASINPGIVLVPGHAFLAWETWSDSGEWDYVETTMIRSAEFEAARSTGRTAAEKHKPRVLSIAELRSRYGINPME